MLERTACLLDIYVFTVEVGIVKGGERWLDAGWLSNRPEPIRSHNPTRISFMHFSR